MSAFVSHIHSIISCTNVLLCCVREGKRAHSLPSLLQSIRSVHAFKPPSLLICCLWAHVKPASSHSKIIQCFKGIQPQSVSQTMLHGSLKLRKFAMDSHWNVFEFDVCSGNPAESFNGEIKIPLLACSYREQRLYFSGWKCRTNVSGLVLKWLGCPPYADIYHFIPL